MLDKALLSLLPVMLFVIGLQLIDTHKLLRSRKLAFCLLAGCVAALVSHVVNSFIFQKSHLDSNVWARTGAPIVEELLEAIYVVWLISSGRVGFMVDGAISGFAVGAGFGVIENLFYLPTIASSNLATASVRGFGTAIMHAGTMSIFALISVNRAEIAGSAGIRAFAPGLLLAIMIHLWYNQAFFGPLATAISLLIAVPLIISLAFWLGERSLEKWIGTKLDQDLDLMQSIASGGFSDSHAGQYLRSLESTFDPMVVGDMLCYVQLSLELSAQAKGDLLRKEMGFPISADPELPNRMRELRYLEKQIGRAGKLALTPLLGSSRRDVWEMNEIAERARNIQPTDSPS